MIITICGPPGSGKDTVANLLLKKIIENGFNYEMMSLGDIKRIAASEKGMTIEQFNEWCITNPKEGDIYFDDFQREHAKKTKDFIMVSRYGWFIIPHSFKLFIDVDLHEGAKRIFEQKIKDHTSRNEYKCKSIDEQMRINNERVEIDRRRALTLYKTDPFEKKNFDLVIDTTKKAPNEVVLEIFDKIQKDL